MLCLAQNTENSTGTGNVSNSANAFNFILIMIMLLKSFVTEQKKQQSKVKSQPNNKQF